MTDQEAAALGVKIALRKELLMLAGLRLPGEDITAVEASMPLDAFIGYACSCPGLTVTAAALMASCLARHIEATQ